MKSKTIIFNSLIFSFLRYGHNSFLVNVGYILICLVALLLVALTLLLIRKLALKYKNRFVQILNFLYNKVFFDTFLRSFIQSYFNLTISCWVTFQFYPLFQTRSFQQITSDLIQTCIALIILFSPLLSFFFLKKNANKLADTKF